MARSIAEYRFVVEGWSWTYALYDDKVVAVGTKGREHQHFEMDLKYAHEVPNRGIAEFGIRYSRRLLLITATIVSSTVPIFGGLIVFTTIFEMRLPDGIKAATLIRVVAMAVAIEIGTALILPHFLKLRNFQRYAVFKRISDGGELLQMRSEVNPSGHSFEQFVEQVIAAIIADRNAASVEPTPSHAFKVGH